MASSRSWRCPLCHSFAARILKGVLRHIGAVHAHEANFHVTCGIQGCPRSYSNYHSYKKHMYQKHREVLEVTTTFSSASEVEVFEPSETDDYPCGSSDTTTHPSHTDEKKQSALFLMKATAVRKISKTTLDGLIGDITILLENRIQLLQESISTALQNKGLEFDAELAAIFQKPSLTSPFQGFHSEFLRKKFYMEKMGFVEPVERRLGQTVTETSSHSYFRKKIDYVYEVPLLSSLKQLLSDTFILEEVLRGHQRHDELLGDYCDGTAYQSHPLFSQDHQALQIMAYYDDVEVCNPLGSRAKKHKLALFYYTLGNISPMYRSTLKCIQLLAITKSSVLQAYGADQILENVMKDVKQLEKDAGVTFQLGETEYTFNGSFALIPGDNLASQYLGGYKALASALRKCRQCMAVDDDMQSEFVSEAFQPRTRETHAAQCSSLDGPLHDHYATTFGINRNSVLNTSRYFHVTEGLVPDVMHDVLEGALPLEVKELMKYLISTKSISLSEINEAMESFAYAGPDACNKPTPIAYSTLTSRDHSLKQTATQMWCLARLLPLMIGEKIEESNPHWDNFLLLLSIVDYCLAPVVSKDWAAYLRMIINDHHKEFKQLYPSCRLTPKMHYMVHFPEIMCKYGPLVRFWCMRFEGKHNMFKDLAHRVKNFKNIPKTMAFRHQELVCYYFNSDSDRSPFCKESRTGPVTTSIVNTLKYKETLLAEFSDIGEDSQLTRISWIEVCGTTYKPGNIVVLGMDTVPRFGIVKDIIVFHTDIHYLVCEALITECFSHHFHAYQTRAQHPVEYIICKQANLYDHTVLTAYVISMQPHFFYVPLKYQLIDFM